MWLLIRYIMLMNVVVQIPMYLIRQASEGQTEVDCVRKQAVFDLFPEGYDVAWKLGWVCGTNSGCGSDDGFGVGHSCSKKCGLRIPLKDWKDE